MIVLHTFSVKKRKSDKTFMWSHESDCSELSYTKTIPKMKMLLLWGRPL